MKLINKFISFFSILLILLSLSACIPFKKGKSKTLTDIPSVQKVTVEINASKLDVFDIATQVFIENGFSILSTNERIGLITTDYTEVKKSFGRSLALALFSREDLEIMLTTNIVSLEKTSIFTILAKGRVKHTTKFKSEYKETDITKDLLKQIENIAQRIKDLAEKK